MARLKIWNATTSQWEYINAPGGSAGGSPDGLLFAKVNLSVEDTLVLNTSPYEFVAAPGPNKMIMPAFVAVRVVSGGSTPYNVPGTLKFCHGNPVDAISLVPIDNITTQILNTNQASRRFSAVGDMWDDFGTSISSTAAINVPFVLTVENDNPTDGDFATQWVLGYSILDLS